MTQKDTFGQRVRLRRQRLGLSQLQLCEEMKKHHSDETVTRTAITMWESEQIENIEARWLLKLAAVFKMDPVELLYGQI